MRIRVGVVGITGYSGLELLKLLLRHPVAECVAAMASEGTGEKPVSEIHPQLRGSYDLVSFPPQPERLANLGLDTVFLCTPNEVSHELVPQLRALQLRVIDLSGSFRLREAAPYPRWYGFDHQAEQLLREAVYGLPEWNAQEIALADLIANPGCYPTSVLLPILPLVRSGMLEPQSEIICDSKSGVSGAGRAVKLEMLFGEVADSFRPYSPIHHRHAPEICQELGWELSNFTFVPHLLPVNRGILSTIYVSFHAPVSSNDIESEFRRCYDTHRFVRILASRLPELRSVNHTNFCDIGWRLTRDGRRGVIFSAIDNLVKGAAGQALQNFNLMHGLEESAGLWEGKPR